MRWALTATERARDGSMKRAVASAPRGAAPVHVELCGSLGDARLRELLRAADGAEGKRAQTAAHREYRAALEALFGGAQNLVVAPPGSRVE